MTAPLFQSEEWTFESLHKVTDAIKAIYDEELGIPYYPIEIRTITSEQMIDAYGSIGLPFYYRHWSLGKSFAETERAYRTGQTHLAYELVINSDPCIVYCMEQNPMTMQALVIAHAALGHNAFFASNYLFKRWTHPQSIVEYAAFAERFVAVCEERHGYAEVEDVLDSAHALMAHAIHYHRLPQKISATDEAERLSRQIQEYERQYNPLMPHVEPPRPVERPERQSELDEPMENILYFIEKNSPTLPKWKREIVRIVYKLAQYFYPQGLTKLMNEGFATFTHHYVMQRLHEKGLITDASFELFIRSHVGVIRQPNFDERGGGPNLNPYALGFAMFTDIKRVCEAPTEEDQKWFPLIVGKPWRDVFRTAVEDLRDDSFIFQHLSPKVIRDFRFFRVLDDSTEDHFEVNAIHDDDGYAEIRRSLASRYDINFHRPLVEVVKVNVTGDQTITLRHRESFKRTLNEEEAIATMKHVENLWEFSVELISEDEKGDKKLHIHCNKGNISYSKKYMTSDNYVM